MAPLEILKAFLFGHGKWVTVPRVYTAQYTGLDDYQ